MKTTPYWLKQLRLGKIRSLKQLANAILQTEKTEPVVHPYDRFLGYAKDMTLKDAPRSMQGAHDFTHVAYLRQWARADWTGTDERIQRFAAVLTETLRKKGIPVYVHCALRTPNEQARLFTLGRSKVRGPKAAHTVGCAVDIVHSDTHWNMTKAEWAYIGYLGKQLAMRLNIPIEWGGDWKFYDPAHWQLKDWKDHEPIYTTAQHHPLHITPRKLLKDTSHLA